MVQGRESRVRVEQCRSVARSVVGGDDSFGRMDRRAADDALADPDGLVFRLREPDGTLVYYTYGVDPELEKESTGLYHAYFDCVQVGAHHWRYDATGDVAAAEESRFWVRTPLIGDLDES